MSHEAYSSKIKAIGKYPACVDVVKCGVLHREKHEVGYATGSHAIMRGCKQQKKNIIRKPGLFKSRCNKNGGEIRSGESRPIS